MQLFVIAICHVYYVCLFDVNQEDAPCTLVLNHKVQERVVMPKPSAVGDVTVPEGGLVHALLSKEMNGRNIHRPE